MYIGTQLALIIPTYSNGLTFFILQCATHSSFGYQITVMPLMDGASKLVAYSASVVLMVLLTFAL